MMGISRQVPDKVKTTATLRTSSTTSQDGYSKESMQFDRTLVFGCTI